MEHNIVEIKREFTELLDTLVEDGFADAFFSIDLGEMRRIIEDCGCECYHGATRIVIAPKQGDYVMKIQMYPEDDGTPGYCRGEAEVYRKAVEEGVSQFFAWSDKIMDYCLCENTKVEIYAMQKAVADDEVIYSQARAHGYRVFCSDENLDPELDSSKAEYDECCCEDDIDCTEGMLEFASTLHDLDAVDALREFIDKHNINDLHSGNWGYINDNFVLIDYAGYEVQVG